MRFKLAVLTALTALVFGGSASPARSEAEYLVTIDPGFQHRIAVTDVEALALRATMAPIETVTQQGAAPVQMQPSPPQVLEIAGCKGSDVQKVEPRIGAVVEDEFVWIARVKGSFPHPHGGRVNDREGYLLVDDEHEFLFGWGVFPKPEPASPNSADPSEGAETISIGERLERRRSP